ncbi:MAG: tetratricopeptide repeat protein [Abitibacteriaceae bacterium]|nr:tetratricopeptide repeat protein [Abditibacteriaceae bacterium]
MKKLYMPLIWMVALTAPSRSPLFPLVPAAYADSSPATPNGGPKPAGGSGGNVSNGSPAPSGGTGTAPKAPVNSGVNSGTGGTPTSAPSQPASAPAGATTGTSTTGGATGGATGGNSAIQEQTTAYNAGLEALKKNDLANAGNYFQRVVTLAPTDASAQMFLGYVLLKQEKYDEALTAFQAARSLSTQLDVKSQAVIDNNIGLVYWNKKMPTEALAAYQHALQTDKTFADAKYNLAFALLSQKRYKEAIPYFTDLLKQNTKDATIYDGLGEAYENTGDWNKALASYNKALEIEPKNAFYQLRIALGLINTNRKKEAVKYLRDATKLDPQNADAFLHLGDIFIQMARWGEAQEALSRYVALRPNDALGWYNLGVAYDFAAKFDDALRAYGEAERLKPDDPAVKNNIGRIYYKRNNLAEAIAQCRKALEIDPNFNDARYNLALVLTAQATQDPNKVDQAKLNEADDEWKKLIDKAGRDLSKPMDDTQRREMRSLLVAARAALAENYLKGGTYADARDEYKRLLTLNPDNIPAMSNLGLALYHTREYEEAAKMYRDIIKKDPHNAIAYNNLGVMLEALKDRAGALEAYRQAAKIKPDYSEAKANIERLTANPA